MEIVIVIFLVFNSLVLYQRVKELQEYAKSQREQLDAFDYQVKELKKHIKSLDGTIVMLSKENRLLSEPFEPITVERLKTCEFLIYN
jgi:uncharacterized coiled-coil DUF342 family protein